MNDLDLKSFLPLFFIICGLGEENVRPDD